MSIRASLVAGILTVCCASCGDEDPTGGSGALSMNGSVVGTSAPAAAKAVVIWTVSSGSPDYLYKYGEGSSTGGQFVLTLTADPPAEAINSYGVGVGLVALVASDTQLPDGRVDEDQVQLLGLSVTHAIIWKDPSKTGLDWSAPFPTGLSCGRCVPAPEGETFDSFEPVDCSQLQVETATDPSNLDACNWT